MSIIDKWNQWYKDLPQEPTIGLYGDSLTYELGAEFLKDCEIVEDWGTGTGAFKLHRKDAIGIDGSNTPQADKKVDLIEYTSSCDGIFMRHVLEHNKEWVKILANALKSAKKICVIVSTPFTDKTTELTEISARNKDYGVDVKSYSLDLREFNRILKGYKVKKEVHGGDTIFYIERVKNESK